MTEIANNREGVPPSKGEIKAFERAVGDIVTDPRRAQEKGLPPGSETGSQQRFYEQLPIPVEVGVGTLLVHSKASKELHVRHFPRIFSTDRMTSATVIDPVPIRGPDGVDRYASHGILVSNRSKSAGGTRILRTSDYYTRGENGWFSPIHEERYAPSPRADAHAVGEMTELLAKMRSAPARSPDGRVEDEVLADREFFGSMSQKVSELFSLTPRDNSREAPNFVGEGGIFAYVDREAQSVPSATQGEIDLTKLRRLPYGIIQEGPRFTDVKYITGDGEAIFIQVGKGNYSNRIHIYRYSAEGPTQPHWKKTEYYISNANIFSNESYDDDLSLYESPIGGNPLAVSASDIFDDSVEEDLPDLASDNNPVSQDERSELLALVDGLKEDIDFSRGFQERVGGILAKAELQGSLERITQNTVKTEIVLQDVKYTISANLKADGKFVDMSVEEEEPESEIAGDIVVEGDSPELKNDQQDESDLDPIDDDLDYSPTSEVANSVVYYLDPAWPTIAGVQMQHRKLNSQEVLKDAAWGEVGLSNNMKLQLYNDPVTRGVSNISKEKRKELFRKLDLILAA